MEANTQGPSKYTPSCVQAIRHGLLVGNTRRAVAEAAGVSPTTLYEWLKDDSKKTFGFDLVTEAGPDGTHVTREVSAPIISFRDMVVQAEASGAQRLVAIIARAAYGGAIKSRKTYTGRNGTTTEEITYALPDPQAAQWLLERKWPGEWAAKKREEDLGHLSDQELLNLLAANEIVSGQFIAESASDVQRQLAGGPGA